MAALKNQRTLRRIISLGQKFKAFMDTIPDENVFMNSYRVSGECGCFMYHSSRAYPKNLCHALVHAVASLDDDKLFEKYTSIVAIRGQMYPNDKNTGAAGKREFRRRVDLLIRAAQRRLDKVSKTK